MNSHTTRQFRELFQQNPSHPGLRFKQVNPGPPPIYSARVGIGYRALAVVEGDMAIWFWIGSHADYDRFLRLL